MHSQIVLTCLYLARFGGPDIPWSVNKICTSSHQMDERCDKRLVRLISYIHHTHFKQQCHVGHTAQQCRLGLFQNSFLEILKTQKIDLTGIWCVIGNHTFVAISWMCKNQTSVSHSSTESEIISLNPAKDCGADCVFSSFVACGRVCLQCFVAGHGPTTLTRLQECAQDIFQSPKQRTRDQFVDLVETQMMDHVEIKMPKISSQESVEGIENVLRERTSARMCEKIGVIEVPKIPSEESVSTQTLSCRREVQRGCVNRLLANEVTQQSNVNVLPESTRSWTNRSRRGAGAQLKNPCLLEIVSRRPVCVRLALWFLHHPAWVEDHTGGSRLTPTVHTC